MTVVAFIGPSLSRVDALARFPGLVVEPPAARGDLYRAARWASTVVLVDGLFESVRSVWHKEILWALTHDVRVLGASSMGALRVAECAAFGMEPVGVIAHDYLHGRRIDDGDVALAHAGEADGWMPLSEALVNVDATLAAAAAACVIDDATAAALAAIARQQFFAQRSWPAILTAARDDGSASSTALDAVASWLPRGRVDQKRVDALEALDSARVDGPGRRERTWNLARTTLWVEAESEFRAMERHQGDGTDHIVEELRVDPVEHRDVVAEARLRSVAAALGEAVGVAIDEAQLEAALSDLIARLGLDRHEEIARWPVEEALDERSFRELLRREALRAWALKRVSADEPTAVVEVLQASRRTHALRRRAADKHATLTELGLDDAEVSRRGGTDDEVTAWWWAVRGETPAVDLDAYLHEHGYADRSVLLQGLRRERLYLQALDNRRADSESPSG